jgi:membrane protein implicated in regulation of membrane protease activity
MRTESAGVSEAFDLSLWLAWFAELDRTFAFLLVLPLVVAAVGLWAHFRERDDERAQWQGGEIEHAAPQRPEASDARGEVRDN